jgi:hypothetical protein
MPNGRAIGLAGSGVPALKGTQIGTTSDGRAIIAWPASALSEVLDPIDTPPKDDPDWGGVNNGDEENVDSDPNDLPPGRGGSSWASTGGASILNPDKSLVEQGDEVCSWVKSDDGGTVGFWFGVQDSSNLYYVYLTPGSETLTQVDGMEDQDLVEYTETGTGTGSFAFDSTTVYEGSYSLYSDTNPDDSLTELLYSMPGDGLGTYPAAGGGMAAHVHGEGGNNPRPAIHFGYQDTNNRYNVQMHDTDSALRLTKVEAGSKTTLASVSHTWAWDSFFDTVAGGRATAPSPSR